MNGTFNTAFQLGEFWTNSKEGLEDKRLAREQARANIDSVNQQIETHKLQTQNAALTLEKLNEEFTQYKRNNLIDEMNYRVKNAFLQNDYSNVIDLLQSDKFIEVFGESPIPELISPFNLDPNEVHKAAIGSATLSGIRLTNNMNYQPSEDDIKDSYKQIFGVRDGNGDIKVIAANQLFEYFFPNAIGMALYEKQKDLEFKEKYKAYLENQKTMQEMEHKKSQIDRNNVQNAKDLHDMNIKANQEQNAQNMSNYLGKLYQEDTTRSIGTDGKGHITSVGAANNGDGSNITLDNVNETNYHKAKLAFMQSNGLSPQEVGMKITELKQFAKADKLPIEIVNEVANTASKYVTKALQDGNTDLAMEYQREINSALGLKVDHKNIDAQKMMLAAATAMSNLTSNNGKPNETFFDSYGWFDKLRNFFSAVSGIIGDDQQKVFDSLNEMRNLQSLIVYDMMGKRVSKHGLAQLPMINEWLTGTANLSVINAHLQRVKDVAQANMIAGDPTIAAWAEYTYNSIDKMQNQINDNRALAKVVSGNGFGNGKEISSNNDMVLVPLGKSVDPTTYNGKTIVNFNNDGNKDSQVEIYLPSNYKEPLQMSVYDFNQLTKGKYYNFTKDIR